MVFHTQENRDYMVMSNHYLCNAGVSINSKGPFCMMLSLPEVTALGVLPKFARRVRTTLKRHLRSWNGSGDIV